MPAKSKAQQEAMAIELERRRSGKKPKRFKSMNQSQLHDFASTPRTGLPARAKKH